MNRRVFSVFMIISMIVSLFVTYQPAKAYDDPFVATDSDLDGLSNSLETVGWYNLSGGPFYTDPQDPDSDNDGLTDGEEKLYDTVPLDSHNPGLAVRYDPSYNTRQYFSTTDPAYLSIKQSGDRYLMTEAVVARRGATLHIAGISHRHVDHYRHQHDGDHARPRPGARRLDDLAASQRFGRRLYRHADGRHLDQEHAALRHF